jgi:hypothetical protein
MGQFAPVGPLSVYRALEDEGILGDYHLLISHKVLEDAHGWHDFYDGLWRRGHYPLVIMDNGVHERTIPSEVDELVEASRVVDASIVVVPDALDDAELTLTLARRYVPELRARCSRPRRLMGVAQGRDERDAIWVGNSLATIGVDMLAVSRDLTNVYGTRTRVIAQLPSDKPVHLLGLSDSLTDDTFCSRLHSVVGIDSAMPVWLNDSCLLCADSRDVIARKRPPNYWEWSRGDVTAYSLRNVQIMRDWVQGTQGNGNGER